MDFILSSTFSVILKNMWYYSTLISDHFDIWSLWSFWSLWSLCFDLWSLWPLITLISDYSDHSDLWSLCSLWSLITLISDYSDHSYLWSLWSLWSLVAIATKPSPLCPQLLCQQFTALQSDNYDGLLLKLSIGKQHTWLICMITITLSYVIWSFLK